MEPKIKKLTEDEKIKISENHYEISQKYKVLKSL